MKKPWHQRILMSYLPWIFMGFLFIGSILDTVSNTLDLITPTVTYTGSLLVLLAFTLIQVTLKKSPVLWITENGQQVYIKSLGPAPLLVLVGVLTALWLPMLTNVKNPTSIPLMTATATPDEILIFIADFNDESNISFDAAGRIKIALDEDLSQYNLSNVRLVRMHQTFKQDEVDKVREEGTKYNASIFIWGHYDDFGVFPRFTILRPENLEQYLPEKTLTNLVNLSTIPDDFSLYVNHELPTQMNFLTQLTIGQIFLLKGDLSQALTLFEKSIETAQNIKSEQFQHNLAIAYVFKGDVYHRISNDFDQAIQDYTKAIAIDPNLAIAYQDRGNAYDETGNFTQAIDDHTKAIQLEPNNGIHYSNRGNAYRDFGNLAQALDDQTQAIRLDSSDAVAYNNRGNTYRDMGNFDKAIEDLSKAIEIAPDFSLAYINRANTYYDFGNYSEAIHDFNTVSVIDPSFVLTLDFFQPWDCSSSYDYHQTIDNYTQKIESDPKDSVSFMFRGNAYRASCNFSQAIADYTQALELEPNIPLLHFFRGLTYTHSKDFVQAVNDYNVAIKLEPGYALALYFRGIVYGGLSEIPLAIRDFDQAIELKPNFRQAYYFRGLIYENNGDLAQAIYDYEYYLKFASNADDRENVIRRIEQLKTKLK